MCVCVVACLCAGVGASMHARMHAYMHTYTQHIHRYIHAYARTHTHTHTHTHTYISSFSYLFTFFFCFHRCYIYIYILCRGGVCTNIYTHIYVNERVRSCTCNRMDILNAQVRPRAQVLLPFRISLFSPEVQDARRSVASPLNFTIAVIIVIHLFVLLSAGPAQHGCCLSNGNLSPQW